MRRARGTARLNRVCEVCGASFIQRTDRPGRFCSPRCRGEGQRKTEHNQVCDNCKRTYRKRRMAGGKTGLRFCSRSCKDAAQRLEGNPALWPSHYGSGPGDVRAKYLKQSCERCGWGIVPAVLQIHHRDRDRENGAESNIETLCPTCHMVEHHGANDGPYLRKHNTPRWLERQTRRAQTPVGETS